MHFEIGTGCLSLLSLRSVRTDALQALPCSGAPLWFKGLRSTRSRPLGSRCHPRRVIYAFRPHRPALPHFLPLSVTSPTISDVLSLAGRSNHC